MSKDEGNSVATQDVSDDEGSNDDQNNTEDTRTVSYEHLRKVLGEKKKAKSQLNDALAKLAEYEEREEAQKQARLKAEGKIAEVLKEEQAKREAAEAKLNHFERTFANHVKFHALKKTLGADIDHKWFDVLDAKGVYDKIEIGEDQRPEEMSVTSVCDLIRKEWPEIIKPASGGGLPSDAPRGSGKLSHEEWSKLPYEEMRKRYHEVNFEE